MSEGSTNRIEEVYRADGDRLWRALLAWTGDREVTNDSVAEAYAQALGRGDELRKPERWIWKAAFRIAAGELKERGRFSMPVGEESYEAEDVTGSLLLALRQLSPMQRGALVLHHFAGYRAGECARILGSSSGAAVRVHLMRGRRRLRELLEGQGDA